VIQGNAVGTDSSGGLEAGNLFGVWLVGGVGGAQVTGNAIAHNLATGVLVGPGVQGAVPTGVVMQSNRVFDNHHAANSESSFASNTILSDPNLVGIDLVPSSVTLTNPEGWLGHTANDPGDADTGANGLQNSPVIASATPAKGGVRLVGTLNSAPSTSYQVEFSGNAACSQSGYGEGQAPLPVITIKTDARGDARFDGRVNLPGGADGAVAALATGPQGTSEYSNCQSVKPSPVSLAPGSLTTSAAGDVLVQIFCTGGAACDGTAAVTSDGAAPRAVATAKKPARRRAGKAGKAVRLRVARGGSRAVKVRLNRKALKRLKKARVLKVTVVVTLRGRHGARQKATATWLVYPPGKR
jgi:hypothetical protein